MGERWRVAHVVRLRLEGEAEDRDRLAADGAAGGGDDAGGHAGLARVVHRDHRFDEARRGTVVLRDAHHRQRVLGEAGAAEARARVEEFAADAAVQPDAAGDVVHVRPCPLTHVGHFVDEGDFHGEEGVGGVFYQLGGFQIGKEDRRLDEIERAVELAKHLAGAVALHADDDAVGAHEVGDGAAFAEEFRVRGDIDFEVGADAGEDFADAAAGADGDGRFGDDDGGGREMLGDLFDGGEHVGEVGVAVAAAGGRADGDEDGVHAGDGGGDVVAEGQAAGGGVRRDQGLQAGLVDGDGAALEAGELGGVHLDHGDVVAEFGETGAGDEAHIASADHCYAHVCLPRGISSAAYNGSPGDREARQAWVAKAGRTAPRQTAGSRGGDGGWRAAGCSGPPGWASGCGRRWSFQ